MVESFFKNHLFQTKTWKDNLGWQDFDPQPVASRTCFCFEMAELFGKLLAYYVWRDWWKKLVVLEAIQKGKSDNRT